MNASVVIPVKNERETAPVIVSQLLDFASVGEVIVVDDGEDGTATLISERFGDATGIHRPDATGLSSAVLRGIDEARCEVIAVMDGDGQHPVGAAVAGIELVRDGADVAVGTRRGEAGSVAATWPASRRLVSWGATVLAKVAVPPARDITDPMSGLFAIRRDCVMAARDRLRPRGYKILLELLSRCPLARTWEFGYEFRDRVAGGSNLGPRQYVQYVRHLGRLTVPSRRGSGAHPREDVDVAD